MQNWGTFTLLAAQPANPIKTLKIIIYEYSSTDRHGKQDNRYV